ncbi:MAG: TrkA C-terminal domain-containing protein [Planctomycetota bacterium]
MASLGFPVITLGVIALLSWLIVRTGARALALSGLDRDVAMFQATSAFFGVGFTTAEAELVVQHPARRRIVMHLVVVGNIGIAGSFATLTSAMMHANADENWLGTLIEFAALAILVLVISKLKILNSAIDWLIGRSLESAGVVRPLDYETVLGLRDGYEVAEVDIDERCPVVGQTLGETRAGSRGMLVLSVTRRGGAFVGAPGPEVRLELGDHLVVYGHGETVRAILNEAG